MEAVKLILTALLSAGALFLIAKVLGHKQMVQLDFFDYITGITIGSIAAEMATELETPWKPLLAMAVYGAVALFLTLLTSKSPRSRKFVNGTPTILMDGGKLYRDNLKKAKLDLSEFMVLCRQAGYFDLTQIQTAVFEYNGTLSILPVSAHRPATPADLGLSPAAERISTEVILDRRILHGNLKRRGLDLNWLDKQLTAQNLKSAGEVFLAVVDDQNKLTVFPVQE